MLEQVIDIALSAGKEVLKIYNSYSNIDFSLKLDGSPLTLADKISNEIILDGIKSISNYPIISEENKEIPYEIRKNWEKFWLVDPLDGTKEFLKKNGEFTINIALIHTGKPVLGVVYAPAKNLLYFASQEGAFKMENNSNLLRLHLDDISPSGKLRAVVSRSHLNAETLTFLEFLRKQLNKDLEEISIGSSLKICYIAEGKADIYPRFSPTMEWDTAAAHAILHFSGGKLVMLNKNINSLEKIFQSSELVYNKKSLKNPPFIAFNPYVF